MSERNIENLLQHELQKNEDQLDIQIADSAMKEWFDSGQKTFSHEEMMIRYG